MTTDDAADSDNRKDDPENLPWENIGRPASGSKGTNVKSRAASGGRTEDRDKKIQEAEKRIEVTIEAIRGNVSQSVLSKRYGVAQPIISKWKRQAIELIRRHVLEDWHDVQLKPDDRLERFFEEKKFESIRKLAPLLRESADLIDSISSDNPFPQPP